MQYIIISCNSPVPKNLIKSPIIVFCVGKVSLTSYPGCTVHMQLLLYRWLTFNLGLTYLGANNILEHACNMHGPLLNCHYIV